MKAKVSVKVKTGSRRPEIKQIGKKEFLVSVKSNPEKGKANKDVVEAIATHFQVSSSRVEIISGRKSKNKIISVD